MTLPILFLLAIAVCIIVVILFVRSERRKDRAYASALPSRRQHDCASLHSKSDFTCSTNPYISEPVIGAEELAVVASADKLADACIDYHLSRLREISFAGESGGIPINHPSDDPLSEYTPRYVEAPISNSCNYSDSSSFSCDSSSGSGSSSSDSHFCMTGGTMRINVLDHGYVELIESWGSEERIIEAARMSTGKGFQGWGDEERPGDEKLLKYLYTHKHSTPFEMAGFVIEVAAPIFVFREWHRHRTQSYNEMSARYTPLPDVNYLPTVDRCMVVSGSNKQAGKASGAAELTHDAVLHWLYDLQDAYDMAQSVYEHGLEIGVPKELARLPVPVARYSRMRASANLRNWLAFLTLRQAPEAQYEIRMFANAVYEIVQQRFPRTSVLFSDSMTR